MSTANDAERSVAWTTCFRSWVGAGDVGYFQMRMLIYIKVKKKLKSWSTDTDNVYIVGRDGKVGKLDI